jgi:hypothetical protein
MMSQREALAAIRYFTYSGDVWTSEYRLIAIEYILIELEGGA